MSNVRVKLGEIGQILDMEHIKWQLEFVFSF